MKYFIVSKRTNFEIEVSNERFDKAAEICLLRDDISRIKISDNEAKLIISNPLYCVKILSETSNAYKNLLKMYIDTYKDFNAKIGINTYELAHQLKLDTDLQITAEEIEKAEK